MNIKSNQLKLSLSFAMGAIVFISTSAIAGSNCPSGYVLVKMSNQCSKRTVYFRFPNKNGKYNIQEVGAQSYSIKCVQKNASVYVATAKEKDNNTYHDCGSFTAQGKIGAWIHTNATPSYARCKQKTTDNESC